MPVIHSCAAEPAVIDGKAKRFNQVQPTLGRQAEPGDISGIRWNFGFDQHNVEHVWLREELKNSKSGDRPAASGLLLEFFAF